MGWIITFVVVQLIMAVIVVLVLRKLLEKELIEAALEKLEYFKPAQGGGEFIIRVASHLDGRIEDRFKSWCGRRFAGSKISFEQDGALKGGVVIVAGGEVLDFSLANRLKNLWSWIKLL